MTIIITVILLLLGVFLSIQSKIREKIAQKRFKHFLLSLPRFEISLDDIKIDGFHWQNSIPVDVHDKELDPNDPYFYETSTYNYSDKYHKDNR
jgi:hypothetical protein